MGLGLLPSQQRELDRAFKKAKAFDRFRVRPRRAFLGLGLGAGGTGLLGLLVGRGTGGERGEVAALGEAAENPRLQVARRLAAAPDEQLWRERHTFLLALEESGGDGDAWVGFRRLGGLALGQAEPVRRQAATRLLKASGRVPARSDYHDLIERLRRAVQ